MAVIDGTEESVYDVALEDKDLLSLLQKPVTESKDYWDNTFGLKEARRKNMNMWLPQHWKDSMTDIYDYQEQSLYQDNRIFAAIETISSTVNARPPSFDVLPASDSLASQQCAKDLNSVCLDFTERYNVQDLFRLCARNLQLKRGGFIKLRFDKNKGQYGEIVLEYVPLKNVVVDKNAKMGEIPRFMAHYIEDQTLEDLLYLLPEAEQKILEAGGVKRTTKSGKRTAQRTQLGKKLNIYEVWFRYLDEKTSKMASGVAWVDENFTVVLDKIKNPNWNYDDNSETINNLLDEPAPPLIPINFLNDGESYFDQTSLIEQAEPLQMILDRRGFQIMDNADQAGSGLVFNTQMISKPDIAKLTGSPDERIGVKGDVRAAVARVAPPPLPDYVIEDKQDARNEIDNIFSTHDITRGQASTNNTLGQDVLQQRGDMSRMDDIARAVERLATGVYRYLIQMMKVFYTEEHYFKAKGEDGQVDFILMKNDRLENGIDIKVLAGSMRPIDKVTQQKAVADLTTQGLIDPLTIYEVMTGGNLPSPQKMLERYMMFKTDPMKYAGLGETDKFDRNAYGDIQVMIAGKMPKIRDEYNAEYLNFINNYMIGGEFDAQPPLVKQLFLQQIQIVQEILQRQMQRMMTQLPTAQDMLAQNQQSAQMQAGAPPPPDGQQQPGGPPSPPQGGISGSVNQALAQRMAGQQKPIA